MEREIYNGTGDKSHECEFLLKCTDSQKDESESKKRKISEEINQDNNTVETNFDKATETPHFSKKPKKMKPGFDSRMFDEAICFRKNGLRCVQPYFFTFTTHCKGRWIGEKLLDIFKKEFRMKTIEYYQKAIRDGKITINNKTVDPDRILRPNEVIRTVVHRHEPPVVDQEFEFIENNDDMVVINKPSSIPVHPCGRYRQNTVVFILGKEYGLKNLHTIHRIDRLTSGILMFAKTVKKAQEMEQFVKGRQVTKEYLCRVVGKFPEEPIVCDQPIKVVSHKVGVCQVDAEGKDAKTEFNFVSYSGKSSVVRCIPHTGRMHQIRVHLQFIGYPIINDPIYNHQFAWGANKGKNGTERAIDDILADLASTRKDSIAFRDQSVHFENKTPLPEISTCESVDTVSVVTNKDIMSVNGGNSLPDRGSNFSADLINVPSHNKEISSIGLKTDNMPPVVDEISVQPKASLDQSKLEQNGKISYDEECFDCKHIMPEPSAEELVMYLHAHSYKGPGWEYKTKLPDWSNVDWLDSTL